MLSLKFLVVFLIASSSAQHQCGRKGMSAGLIVGGTKSVRNEWPWLASLFDITTQKFFCGATIISEEIVMTAAHCLQPKESSVIKRADEVVAYLGKHNVKLAHERDVEAFYPSEVLIHPDWKVYEQKYDADLAIMRSESSSIKFSSKISPACLWTDNFDENVEGFVVGWGSSNVISLSEHEDVSRQVKVKRISSQKCYEDFHLFASISSRRTFCGGGVVESSGPCAGDSGGGFFVSINNIWFINGIVSASFLTSDSHCDLNKYTVFTDLIKFKDWIDDKIKASKTTSTVSALPNRTICSGIDNLYENRIGSRRYLKSLCTITGSRNYEEAEKMCNEAGMQIFAVDTLAVRNSLLNALKIQFESYKSADGWIYAKQNPSKAGRYYKYEYNSGSHNFSSIKFPLAQFTFCEFRDSFLPIMK